MTDYDDKLLAETWAAVELQAVVLLVMRLMGYGREAGEARQRLVELVRLMINNEVTT